VTAENERSQRVGEPGSADVPPAEPLRIGVVSDTHGYLDPAVLDAFAGVDLILHAGDVGAREVLDSLRTVAPVMAIAGNLDGSDRPELTSERTADVAGVRLALGHKRKRLVKRLLSGGAKEFDLVVFGHDHVPSVSWAEGTLWLNPGSASAPYEEDDGPTVAVVERLATGLGVAFTPLLRRESPPRAPSAKHGKGKGATS
jgi:putative phosphoesterase